MVPLVLSAPTSTDKVPALPRLSPTASRDVIGANLWNWKTSVTSPREEDIKPRPLQRHLSGSGGTTAAMSLKHAWLILQMVPLVLSAPTSTDKVPALPRLSPTASRDVIGANLWNWKTSVTSPREEDIKPRPLQRHLSGSGGTTAAMSLKHAWLILQMVPLVLSAPTSTDKVPALPRLSPTASRDVIGANLWNWKTSVTSPREEDIKPRPLQRHLSGSGGTTAVMSLKHAWLILQMVPLVLSAPTSTDKVPALPRLSPTASRDVIGANLWNWKTSVTSPREEDIKPRPLQRHLSGSGGTTAAMSLKHAWLILQMVPLVLSAPTSTDKVPALPRLSPTASRDVIGANLWNWKTSVTSPREEDIKPRPLQWHLSGSGGTTAAMSLKHAWLILQMVPLVLSAPTSTDKVPALPRLSPTASRDVIGANLWNWKTSVTSPREEDIKPRPLQRHVSGSGGTTAAMSLKHAWLILQMVPLVLSAPTSTDKVPALPRLSPTASRDVIGANLWNWKTSVTSPREEDIKPRPLQRHLSGSGGTTAAMSLKHAWLILQMVPLVLSAPTSTDKVPALPRLSPTASRDVIGANLWNWKTSRPRRSRDKSNRTPSAEVRPKCLLAYPGDARPRPPPPQPLGIAAVTHNTPHREFRDNIQDLPPPDVLDEHGASTDPKHTTMPTEGEPSSADMAYHTRAPPTLQWSHGDHPAPVRTQISSTWWGDIVRQQIAVQWPQLVKHAMLPNLTR
ncbi:hypothetical protein MRX96_024824 [Rhipicephalus microplus]